jgi:1-carboxybiuret hydrolase
MTDWCAEPGYAVREAIAKGQVSALAVTEAYLAAINAKNGTLHAYTDVTAERARARAAAIDASRARGADLPPLAGVPFAAKNLFDIAGLPTRAGSKINRVRAPAKGDATAVRRMEEAGAILLGGLNMGEYAYDFTGQNIHDDGAVNPHDPERLTGGSSSGSAAAAAAGLAAITLGSDTNGSIRVPASLCGLFGLKPTYGALSRAGTFPFVSSLDHVGPLARSVIDLALSFDAMSGPDNADPVCAAAVRTETAKALHRSMKGIRIATAAGYFHDNAQADALEATGTIARALGASSTIAIPHADKARAAAFIITMIEGAALHLERLKTQHDAFDPAVRDRLIAGAMLPGAWHVQAQKFRRWFRDETMKLFEQVDVILAPATPVPAPLVSDKTFMLNGVELPVRANLGLLTQPISFIGLPVVTVPVWLSSGLPIGVQIITAQHHEALALAVAAALERDGVSVSHVAKETA